MYNHIHSVDEMPHISADEFCADIDHIFDKVIKEHEAYVLETEGGSYVLCPASWLEYEHRRIPNIFANYSVRHAFDRNAETARLVCDAVRASLPTLTYGVVEKMIADVSVFVRTYPENPNTPIWSALLDDLKKEMQKIETVEEVLHLDIDMLVELEQRNRKRDLTLQQWIELMFEKIVRSDALEDFEIPKEES